MSFDRLAPFYRAMEFVLAGRVLHRCRTAFLPEIPSIRTALLVGEGPGRFLEALLRSHPSTRVTCVEASGKMIEVARHYLRQKHLPEAQVEFVCADLANWSAEGKSFDLVATHFFWDCFPAAKLAELVPKVASAARQKGSLWIISDFREPAAGAGWLLAKFILRTAYPFFRWTTGLPASRLVPVEPFVQTEGFRLAHRRLFYHGVLHADCWVPDV